MFRRMESREAAAAFAALHTARDEQLALPLHSLADADLLAAVCEHEADARRSAAFVHAATAELEARGIAREHGCSSTANLLVQLLRINPDEASGRVRAAADLGPRHGLSGEVLPPLFAPVAAAQAAGDISGAHARVVIETIDHLPDAVQAEHDLTVQAALIEQALVCTPRQLAQIAHGIRDYLDPDGTLTTERDRHRRRELRIQRHTDGSARIEGELTALCAEALLCTLEPLAAPVPASADGTKDPRTYGQRLHDALYDAALIALRSQQLPDCAGVAATILITMTEEQFGTGTGLAATGHGAHISIPEALTLFGDARIMPVVLGRSGEIIAYGSTRRIFSEGQRLAMIARDQGCSFPGCTQPPTRCQAHHITDYAVTGRTSVTDGTLLCGFHHREFQKLGWTCHMINATPHWTPPLWLDRSQTPRRNQARQLPCDAHHALVEVTTER